MNIQWMPVGGGRVNGQMFCYDRYSASGCVYYTIILSTGRAIYHQVKTRYRPGTVQTGYRQTMCSDLSGWRIPHREATCLKQTLSHTNFYGKSLERK